MSFINFEHFLSACAELKSQQQSFVTVTLVRALGSAPQDLGARAIVNSQGLYFGTVGGGKIEKRAIEYAQELLNSNREKAFEDWNLQTDIGMTCGGTVTLLFEVFRSSRQFNICLFGAGHVCQALSRLLLNLDCTLTVVDSRQEWLDKLPENERLKKVCTSEMASYVLKIPNGAFVGIMTMGHGTDLPVLIEVMRQSERFSYIGNIGSDVKAKRLREDLKRAGIEQSKIDKLYCPIGENFGSNTPVEIAFSIIAQLLKVRDQVLNSN